MSPDSKAASKRASACMITPPPTSRVSPHWAPKKKLQRQTTSMAIKDKESVSASSSSSSTIMPLLSVHRDPRILNFSSSTADLATQTTGTAKTDPASPSKESAVQIATATTNSAGDEKEEENESGSDSVYELESGSGCDELESGSESSSGDSRESMPNSESKTVTASSEAMPFLSKIHIPVPKVLFGNDRIRIRMEEIRQSLAVYNETFVRIRYDISVLRNIIATDAKSWNESCQVCNVKIGSSRYLENPWIGLWEPPAGTKLATVCPPCIHTHSLSRFNALSFSGGLPSMNPALFNKHWDPVGPNSGYILIEPTFCCVTCAKTFMLRPSTYYFGHGIPMQESGITDWFGPDWIEWRTNHTKNYCVDCGWNEHNKREKACGERAKEYSNYVQARTHNSTTVILHCTLTPLHPPIRPFTL